MDSNTLSNQADGGGLGDRDGRDLEDPAGRELGEPDGRELGEPDGREPVGRDGPGLGQPDGREPGDLTYWRRRFMALAIGLGILSLIAWAFSGALGGSGAGGPAAAGGARAARDGAARAGTDSGGSRGAATPGAQPQASASAAAGPSGSVQPSASPGTAAQAQAGRDAPAQLAALAPQPAPHPARACDPGDVVLSLFVGQASYARGQVPEFDVDVVSTSARTCGFDVGARHLSVVVRAHGNRVFVSADCAAGHGTLTTNLSRGVPVVVPISWNGQTSALACRGGGQQVPAGKYTASASDNGVASNPVRFTLG